MLSFGLAKLPFLVEIRKKATMMSPIKQISVSEMDRGVNDGGLVRLWQVLMVIQYYWKINLMLGIQDHLPSPPLILIIFTLPLAYSSSLTCSLSSLSLSSTNREGHHYPSSPSSSPSSSSPSSPLSTTTSCHHHRHQLQIVKVRSVEEGKASPAAGSLSSQRCSVDLLDDDDAQCSCGWG